jgi:hypothetical protein
MNLNCMAQVFWTMPRSVWASVGPYGTPREHGGYEPGLRNSWGARGKGLATWPYMQPGGQETRG